MLDPPPTLATIIAAGVFATAALVSASVHSTRFWRRHQKGLTITATRQSETECTVEVSFNPQKSPRHPQMVIRGLFPRSLRLLQNDTADCYSGRRDQVINLRRDRPTGSAECRMDRDHATFTARASLSSCRAFQSVFLLITVRDQVTHHRIDRRVVGINPLI